MRTRIRTRIIAGLVGGAIMSMLGPRPIFVRTAYAADDTAIEEVVMYDVDADDCDRDTVGTLVLDTRD